MPMMETILVSLKISLLQWVLTPSEPICGTSLCMVPREFKMLSEPQETLLIQTRIGSPALHKSPPTLRLDGARFRTFVDESGHGGTMDPANHRNQTRSRRCSPSVDAAVVLPNSPGDDSSRCPAECPFAQPLAGDHCAKVCVLPEQCAEFHPARAFGDPVAGRCVPTCGPSPEDLVPGCSICAARGKCAQCISSMFGRFELSADGRACLNPNHRWWKFVYVILAALVGFCVVYLVLLANCRPSVNEHVLPWALEHRRRCRPMQSIEAPDGRIQLLPYSWWRTSVHDPTISGVGVALYFNWLVFIGAVAVCVWTSSQVAFWLSSRELAVEEHLKATNCTSDARGKGTRKELVESTIDFEMHMFYCFCVTYFLVLIASWAFCAYQLHFYRSLRGQTLHLSKYALLVSGLPGQTADYEDRLASELRRKLGETQSDEATRRDARTDEHAQSSLVGVSLCYALAAHQDAVGAALGEWLDDAEGASGPAEGHATVDVDVLRQSELLNRRWWTLAFVDDLLVPSAPSESSGTDSDWLNGVQCSGQAFVVLRSEAAATRLAAALGDDPRLLGSTVKWSRPLSEPRCVLWANFEKPQCDRFWIRFALGVLCTVFTVLIWACLYLPYALEYLQAVQIPGMAPSSVNDLLLGGLIGVGNMVLSGVIEVVADRVRFRFADQRDAFVLIMGFLMNILNVVADVWMTMEIAEGSRLDLAFSGTAIGYELVIEREMFALVVPGYLFTPYLLAPIFELLLPYWVYRWLVRADRRFARRHAEQSLEATDFRIEWRYADHLANFSICALLLVFLRPTSSSIMVWLATYVAFVYIQDRTFLISCTSQNNYDTHRLSSVFAAFWAVPLSAVAGATAWWGMKAGGFKGVPFLGAKGPHVIWIMMLGHILLYLFVMAWIYRLLPPSQRALDVDLEETLARRARAGEFANYFNTNPGFCLLSRGAGVTLPYARGKTHLLTGQVGSVGGLKSTGVLLGRVRQHRKSEMSSASIHNPL